MPGPRAIQPGPTKAHSMPTPEELRASMAFWQLFMPRYQIGPMVPIDACTGEACANIIDAVLDMLKDVVDVAPNIRRVLTFPSNPPHTAEELLLKVREQLKPNPLPQAGPGQSRPADKGTKPDGR